MTVAQDLSIQLYSLRAYRDLEAQLEALAGLGFKQVETVGGHLEDAEATRGLLDRFGIAAQTGHVGLADLRQRPDWVVDQAAIVGITQLFMPAVPPAERSGQPAEYWRALGTELGELAARWAGKGPALGYHNHHWELDAYADGTTPLEHLFAGAAGSPLNWEADLAWLVRGGADPLAWMERYRDLLVAVHVKDLAPEGLNADEDGWASIGAGRLDWPSLWRESVAHGARFMVLEHDKPKDPIGFARDSRAFLLQHVA
jgi:sugar phosphate isomerase/epimerase